MRTRTRTPPPRPDRGPALHLTWRRLLVAVLLLLLFCLGAFAYQAWSATSALLSARGRAVEVERLVTTGDFDGATRELARLRQDTHTAATATDGVLWDLGRHLPVVGPDIGAVQTSASVLDHVTRDNSPVALRLARTVDAGDLRPRDGRIDLGVVRELSPIVDRAARSIRREQARLDEVDLDALTFPFREVLGELVDKVERAGSAATATATAFDLLPPMLGGDGPRTYLLLVQNNAEIRSTGGIPGSVAILHADHGRVSMGFQGSAGDVATGDPAPGTSADALAVYGSTVRTDPRDVTFNPDFPDVARTTAAMLQARRGLRVDGVVSVDPVALSLLLRGTGPVEVTSAGGRKVTLGAGNVVQSLLNLTYQVLPDQASQNDFFARSARSIFDAVMSGGGSPRLTITGLASGVAQHRVLLWSRHPAEQRRLDGTAVAGALPSGGPAPQVGVYLNDATAGKPEYYLDYSPVVSARRCRADGSQDLDVTVALRSTMPRDFSSLSRWITGTGAFAPRGTIAFNLRLYGPRGGTVTSLTLGRKRVTPTADRHKDRQVAVVPVALAPGQRVVLHAKVRSGPGQTGGPVLSFTPGIRPEPNAVRLTSACPR